VGVKSGSL